jgi:hypothetical protein
MAAPRVTAYWRQEYRMLTCSRTRSRSNRRLAASTIALVAFTSCNGGSTSHGPSNSAVIGSDGGTLAIAGATITIPPGALGANQTITVRQTDLSAPPGYQLYSPIFEFDPAGLQFAAPVPVRIDYHGDPTLAQFYWSRVAGPGYDVQASTLSGTTLTATVTHFSTGFVGTVLSMDGSLADSPQMDAALDVGTDDGAPGDAVGPDSLDASDAGSGDAALVCNVIGDGGAADTGSGITCTFTRVTHTEIPSCNCGLPPSSCTTQYNVGVTIDNGTGCCDQQLIAGCPMCMGRALHVQAASLFSMTGGNPPDFLLDCAPPNESWTAAPPGTNRCHQLWTRGGASGTISVTGGASVSVDFTDVTAPGGPASMPSYNCAGVTFGCTTLTLHCFGTTTAM